MKQNRDNEPELNITVATTYTIRSKNNYNDFCKQVFRVLVNGDNDPNASLCVHKFVLSDKFILYEKYGFISAKQFKNKRLYKQVFSIKLKTLEDALNTINFKHSNQTPN